MFHVEHDAGLSAGTLDSQQRYPELSSGCLNGTRWNSMEPAKKEGTMWIALFSIASASAIGLSVAAMMLQASQGDALRS
jgi:hypothetical protein